jgi:hypothetical protein
VERFVKLTCQERLKVIASVLGALVTLAAEHGTQAQNVQHVSWVLPAISGSTLSKLAATEENLRDLDHVESRNIARKIGSADGSDGRRCEMSPEEFARVYPPLLEWIRTKVVLVDPLPMPPLSSMGLARFADFERGDFDGITYIDTIFLKPTESSNENMHFHELVHVIQWRLLGPDRFLLSYANGLECFGYRQSPLEAMAYDAETAFASSTATFNVEKMVAEKLGL